MKYEVIEKVNDAKIELYKCLKSPEVYNTFTDETIKLIHSVMETMVSDISIVIERDVIQDNEVTSNPENLIVLLRLLEKLIALQAISKETNEFLNLFLQYTFNFNKNILRNNEINDSIMVCQRLLSAMLTMSETINVLKTLSAHIEAKLSKESDPLYKGLTSEYINLLNS